MNDSNAKLERRINDLRDGDRAAKIRATATLPSLEMTDEARGVVEQALVDALREGDFLVRASVVVALVKLNPAFPPQRIVDALRSQAGKSETQGPWRMPDADEVLELGLSNLESLPLVAISLTA